MEGGMRSWRLIMVDVVFHHRKLWDSSIDVAAVAVAVGSISRELVGSRTFLCVVLLFMNSFVHRQDN